MGACCCGFQKWRQEPPAQPTGLPDTAEAWHVCHTFLPGTQPTGSWCCSTRWGGHSLVWLRFERETGKGYDWTVLKRNKIAKEHKGRHSRDSLIVKERQIQMRVRPSFSRAFKQRAVRLLRAGCRVAGPDRSCGCKNEHSPLFTHSCLGRYSGLGLALWEMLRKCSRQCA